MPIHVLKALASLQNQISHVHAKRTDACDLFIGFAYFEFARFLGQFRINSKRLLYFTHKSHTGVHTWTSCQWSFAKVRISEHNTKQNAKFFLLWLINMQLSFDLYKNMGIFISCTQNFIWNFCIYHRLSVNLHQIFNDGGQTPNINFLTHGAAMLCGSFA